jgi:hypothetical protein
MRASRRLLAVRGPADAEVEWRDLAVYDAVCGSGEGAA